MCVYISQYSALHIKGVQYESNNTFKRKVNWLYDKNKPNKNQENKYKKVK